MDDNDRSRPPVAPVGPGLPAAGQHFRRLVHLAHAIGADDELPIDPDLGPDDISRPASGRRRSEVPVHAHRASPAVLAAIFTGGFVGTLARYAVEDAWPSASGHFPTATFVINTSGAFLLGVLLTVLLERLRSRHHLLRPFAVTGVLGGWTTYSTMVAESVTLGHDGRIPLAAGYLAVTLLCGVTGIALGIAVGRSRQLDGLATVDPPGRSPDSEGARR